MNRLLGLFREPDYSPGRHQSNDALILEQVAAELRGKGFTVDLKTKQELRDQPAGYDLVLSMCQGRDALKQLANWEKQGVTIVNSAYAARNTHRDRLPDLMKKAGIPFPETRMISTTAGPDEVSMSIENGLWVKRGDVHASVAADVQRVNSPQALVAVLAELRSRNVETAVIQRHQTGAEIKFYAVGNHQFFYWLPARADLLKSNIRFNEWELRGVARRAAAATGLEIFGGDVIVSGSGELTLIDLNDWPSFAPCRKEACRAIADFVAGRGQKSQQFVSSANQNAL